MSMYINVLTTLSHPITCSPCTEVYVYMPSAEESKLVCQLKISKSTSTIAMYLQCPQRRTLTLRLDSSTRLPPVVALKELAKEEC